MTVSAWLRRLDLGLSVLILFLLVTLIILQIIARSVFSLPLAGSEELARYFLLWVVFLPLALVARSGDHIRMAEIQALLPVQVRRFVQFASALIAVFCYSVVTVSAAVAALGNIGRVTPSLGMPFLLFYLPTVIGFILFTLEYLILLVRVILFRDLSLLDNDQTSAIN